MNLAPLENTMMEKETTEKHLLIILRMLKTDDTFKNYIINHWRRYHCPEMKYREQCTCDPIKPN